MHLVMDIAEGPMAGWYRKDYERQSGGYYEARYHGNYQLFYPVDDGTQKDKWRLDSYQKQTKAL